MAHVTDIPGQLRTVLTRSSVLWIGAPGGPHHIAWFARASHPEGTCLVISGAGEQHLPTLPEPSEVIFRRRDTRTPVGPLPADVELIGTHDTRWDDCVADLAAARQGVPSNDLLDRWRAEARIWAVTPRTGVQLPPAG